jgi:hypothetical protein
VCSTMTAPVKPKKSRDCSPVRILHSRDLRSCQKVRARKKNRAKQISVSAPWCKVQLLALGSWPGQIWPPRGFHFLHHLPLLRPLNNRPIPPPRNPDTGMDAELVDAAAAVATEVVEVVDITTRTMAGLPTPTPPAITTRLETMDIQLNQHPRRRT